MTKNNLIFVTMLFLAVFSFSAVSVQAVAIDDTITPQNCERTDPACAQFVDTTSRGQIKWGAFVAGGLRSLTNLFVDGKMGVGTLRPSTGEQVLKLDVEGAMGAKFYCDENGNNCVAGNNLGGGGGTTVNIDGGTGITVNRAGNTYNISINSSTTQRRINGVCSGANAIKQVNEDGSVVCQSVGTGNGDTLWGVTAGNSANILNLNTGNVGVGKNNPTAKLDVTKANATGDSPVFSAIDSQFGNGGKIGINGNGAEFFGNAGLSATSPSANGGIGLSALASGAGESYGAKLIGTKIGSYNKGFIGLYATDMTNSQDESTAGRDNRIPLSLFNDNSQYAAYFDGKVGINGNVFISGGNPGSGKILASNDTAGNAVWKTPAELGITNGGGNGTRESISFEVYSSDATTQVCVDKDLESLCGDEDGCDVNMRLTNEVNDVVQGGVAHLVMEQTSASNNRVNGISGYTTLLGSSAAWTTGTNAQALVMSPFGDAISVYNYRPAICQGGYVAPSTDPYQFTFRSSPNTRAHFIVLD